MPNVVIVSLVGDEDSAFGRKDPAIIDIRVGVNVSWNETGACAGTMLL